MGSEQWRGEPGDWGKGSAFWESEERDKLSHQFFNTESAKERREVWRKREKNVYVISSQERISILPEIMSTVDKYILEVCRSD